MFDGDDEFHQFIAACSTTSLVPFTVSSSSFFFSFSAADSFDPYPSPSHDLHPPLPVPLISTTTLGLERERDKSSSSSSSSCMDIDQAAPWSNDELLALLKLTSTMDIHFTWEHVSRKLGEVGFKRSGEQCKERFEESCRHFHYFHPTTATTVISSYNNNNNNNNNNYTDDDLYTGDDQDENILEKQKADDEEDVDKVNKNHVEEESHEVKVVLKSSNKCKKKRKKKKFEMFKGLCEGIVKKMIDQQEEFHKKLIEDIVKRDEENIDFKNEERERIIREIEMREKSQAASAGERQATIIDFFNKFIFTSQHKTTDHDDIDDLHLQVVNLNYNSSSLSCNNNISQKTHHHIQDKVDDQTSSFNPSNPTNDTPSPTTSKPNSTAFADPPSSAHYERSGGDLDIIHMRNIRWPRDEVLALINLRCKLMSSTDHQSYLKEEGAKGPPLWERISQGMLELGYKRSPKRCKEKWENINKYFRKTKDNTNKKRSIDSRTCPYFHLLTSLYSAGTVNVPEN